MRRRALLSPLAIPMPVLTTVPLDLSSLPSAVLAQSAGHLYGFEGTFAQAIFVVGFTAVLIFAIMVTKIRLLDMILAGMLFVTALTAPVDWVKYDFIRTWMFPVQRVKAEIHLGLGILLTLLVLFRGVRAEKVPWQSLVLLLMSLYAALLQYIHNDASFATQSLIFALATMPCVIAAMPLVLTGYDGCIRVLRVIMYVSALWTFCCSVQFVINPELLLNNQGRFWGLLANAQHAAVLISGFAVVALWLILNDSQKRTRPLWIALLAINMLFLVWTGSRTGALMFVIGTAGVLYARIGKFVLFLPVAALMLWGLFALAEALQIGANLERLVSTEDTRQGVWSAMLQNALENPLIGVGWGEDTGGSENSYLGGFAAYGIVYFALISSLLLGSIFMCIRMTLSRKLLPPDQRPLIDLVCAYCAMYLSGAMFEGYILARSSSALMMMLMVAGMALWINEQMSIARNLGYDVSDDVQSLDEPAYGDYGDGNEETATA